MEENPVRFESPPIVPPPLATGGQPLNPWFSLWTRPRATMRQILDTDPRGRVILLTVLAGVVTALSLQSQPRLLELLPLEGGTLFLVALLAAPIWLLIVLYVGGFLVAVVGGWLGGVGDGVAVRAAIGWSYVPTLWAALLLIPQYVLLDGWRLEPSDLQENPAALAVLGLLGLLQIVIGFWAVVIHVKCIGEAHRFSAWRALATLILSGIAMLAVLLVPALYLYLLGQRLG
jgi:Yip1 domain